MVLSCRYLKLLDRTVSGARSLTGGVCECFFIGISCSIPSTVFYYFSLSLIGWYCRAGVFELIGCIQLSPSLALRASFNNNNNDNNSKAGLLFPCQYLCGIILVTPYSMMWNWRVSRAEPMPFYWPCCSLSFCLLLFSFSLLSFYGLALWAWGLRTDMVLITLSQPALSTFFNNNNNITHKIHQNITMFTTKTYFMTITGKQSN